MVRTPDPFAPRNPVIAIPMRHLQPIQILAALLLASLTAATASDHPTPAPPPSAPRIYTPAAFPESHEARAARIRALASEIRELFEQHAREDHIPGLAYGVVVDHALVVSGGLGFAQVEHQVPATPASVFRIASMTKSFTAMAVLRLRDAGRVDLDRPAARYLPELRRLPLLTRDAPPITLRQLLTHGAGFPEDNPWGDRQLADTDQDLIELVRAPAWMSNTPDVAYEYSNLGYALLGRAVARVSKATCQNYITRHILNPLDMHSTFWDPAEVPADRLAHGYRWEDEIWKPEVPLADGSFGPMGGMLSSVEDFARYMALHLGAWPPRDDPESPVIRRASIREMHHPWRISGHYLEARDGSDKICPLVTAYGYGLGWGRDCHERVRIGHSGGLPGFGSQWRILPEYGIGVVGFGNVTYAGFGLVNTRVLERIIDRAQLRPRALPPSPILRSRAEALVRLLPDWQDAERSGLFAENFFPDTPIETLRQDCRKQFAAAGRIQSIGEIVPENQLRGTVVLHGEHADLEVLLTLTPENPPLIQEFSLRTRTR